MLFYLNILAVVSFIGHVTCFLIPVQYSRTLEAWSKLHIVLCIGICLSMIVHYELSFEYGFYCVLFYAALSHLRFTVPIIAGAIVAGFIQRIFLK